MISKDTGSVCYALYKMECEPYETDVEKYVSFYNKNDFLWYQFDDRKMEDLVGWFNKAIKSDEEVIVDLVRYNHLFSCLKRMCQEEKKNKRGEM